MRNRRGAFGALILAGAAYLWTNRDRLTQQFNTLRNQRGLGGTDRTSPTPQALPDLSATEQREFDRPQTDKVYREREFGGTQF